MRKSIFILTVLFLFLVSEHLSAQRFKFRSRASRLRTHEFVFGIGATTFLGDLGGANAIGTNGMKDLDIPATRPVLQLGYLYQFRKHFGLKTSLFLGQLAGDDNWTDEKFRNNRNLHFKTNIIELSTQLEVSVISGGRQSRRFFSLSRRSSGYGVVPFSLYGFVGVGGFYYNPKAKYTNGDWYSLKPLSTEGQGLFPTRKNYSLVQLVVPVGLGLRYYISNEWSIGIEYGRRFSFTDYIDDVSKSYADPNVLMQEVGPEAVYFANPSPTAQDPDNDLYGSTLAGQQRGDPRDKDAYMYALITIYYKIARYSARLYRY